MKLLLAAATPFEIAPVLAGLATAQQPDGSYRTARHEVHSCITGVGLTATTYSLTKAMARQRFDLVLQAGVGGAFDRATPLGSLWYISSEAFADLGAEDHGQFLDLFALGLQQANTAPFSGGRLMNPAPGLPFGPQLPVAAGITVHTVSGSEATIAARAARYPDVLAESMEGAALHYVCLREGVPFAQVRAISNHVTPRDKSSWQMKAAIDALNRWLTEALE